MLLKTRETNLSNQDLELVGDVFGLLNHRPIFWCIRHRYCIGFPSSLAAKRILPCNAANEVRYTIRTSFVTLRFSLNLYHQLKVVNVLD